MPTPVHAGRLNEVLEGYDLDTTQYLVECFTEGFKLGYEGTGRGITSPNLKSVSEHPEVVKEKIKKELNKGGIAGPFETPPFEKFWVSPIGVVPKKQAGKFRITHHLSYPLHESVNAGIPDHKAVVHYASTDDAVQLIKRVGRQAWLVKLDIEAAFKIVPVHPQDYYLLGFSLDGKIYYDKTLPMGCRSSCAIFETLSTAMEWVAIKKLGIEAVSHILDDFLLISRTKERGETARKKFESLCQGLGVPLAPDKTEGPTKCLSFAGIELDTENMEARLPNDKIEKCKEKIMEALGKNKVTLRELQSVIGLLNFACKVVRPGRAFLRRLINLTIGFVKPFHHIRMTKTAKADLYTWLSFLQKFNGKSFFLSDEWLSDTSLHLYTDASGPLGYGAVFGSNWFHGVWPIHWKGKNITLLELFPIVAAVIKWAPMFKNSRVIMHTDNMALVHILNATTSKDPLIMVLVRKFVVSCMLNNVQVKVEHIPGVKNVLADKLSRQQVQEFQMLAPWADE